MAIVPPDPNAELPDNDVPKTPPINDGVASSGANVLNKEEGMPNPEGADLNEPDQTGSEDNGITVGEATAIIANTNETFSGEEVSDESETAIPEEIETVATPATPVKKRYLLEFEGRGNDYFFIAFRGYALTVLTLGLYYPWARVQRMRYMLNNLWLDGSPFVFEAKGEEVFKGFIKVYVILAALAGIYVYGLFSEDIYIQAALPSIFTLFGAIITPLAIHGSFRYRASKTSWKGIYFNYTGNLGDLYVLFLKNTVLIAITLGIYNPWAQVDLTKYLAKNIKLGNIEFKYQGEGNIIFNRIVKMAVLVFGIGALFILTFLYRISSLNSSISNDSTYIIIIIILIAYILYIIFIPFVIINFRIWKMKYNLNTTFFRLGKNIGTIDERLNVKSLTWFEVVNALLLTVTLGIGIPFVAIRRMQKYTQLISFVAAVNLDDVRQTGGEYSNAFAEDLGDQFDIQLDLM
jgi:uncharacterized membrane protein YjgN (DUF898 family)